MTTGARRGTGDAHAGAAMPCLNCGTMLAGAFCHACGQDAHVHRNLGAIGHDLLHGAFHFEGRILRTLPMLLRDPGGLTRRYIAGERVRFVQPFALFLFGVFLTFALLHLNGVEIAGGSGVGAQERAAQLRGVDAEIAGQRAALARADALPANDPARAVERAAARAALRSLAAVRATVAGKGRDDDLADIPDHLTGWARLDHGIAHARDNPALALYELQGSAYKYSWALIPLSTPFVALLFLWRRRFTMYDHAIFVIYSLDFMLLLVAACMVAGAAGASSLLIGGVLLLVPPVHIFAQLRGAYGLRRRSALWRTAALLVFAWAALAAFLAMLIALGLLV